MLEETAPKQHDWRIDEREYKRHEQRRGRRHAYESLDPNKTALVVVDMIPFFVDDNSYALGIVPRIQRLADVLREAAGTVAWVVPESAPPTEAEIAFFGREVAELYGASGGQGPVSERIAHQLTHPAQDILVTKSARSAFFPGRCALHEMLEWQGIQTVLIAGTAANVCCESSARDASTLGYRVIMVADANAAPTDELLNATLTTVYRSFGDVRTSDELLGMIGRATR